MTLAVVFPSQAAAENAQQLFFGTWRDTFASWVDANGAIVGANAATDLPAVRHTRTVRWAEPRQRADTLEWWIVAPPQTIMEPHKAALVAAGYKLMTVADSWTPITARLV